MLVETSVAVTFASGTPDPLASVTLPEIVPVVDWATPTWILANANRHASINLNRFSIIMRSSVPESFQPLVQVVADKVIVCQLRVTGAHPVDLFQLSGRKVFRGVQTPAACQ